MVDSQLDKIQESPIEKRLGLDIPDIIVDDCIGSGECPKSVSCRELGNCAISAPRINTTNPVLGNIVEFPQGGRNG